jgi:putative aldouronate transport system permease protein
MVIQSREERIIQVVIYISLFIFSLICLFPFLYVVSISFTSPEEVLRRNIVFIPQEVTFSAYKTVLNGYGLGNAYEVTLFRTIVGTLLNLVFTIAMAYALSKKYLPGRSPILLFVVFTMLFSGGLIPSFILIKWLGLLNSMWVYVIPPLISAFNLIIVKAFFENIPQEIEDSAKVDGAGDILVLMKIIMPLSKPIIATIGLFYAVFHWNSYFDGVMFVDDPDLYPLQVVLRNILINFESPSQDALNDLDRPASVISIQMAAVMMSTLPILAVYPFIQKHFTKGVLLGSIKG